MRLFLLSPHITDIKLQITFFIRKTFQKCSIAERTDDQKNCQPRIGYPDLSRTEVK